MWSAWKLFWTLCVDDEWMNVPCVVCVLSWNVDGLCVCEWCFVFVNECVNVKVACGWMWCDVCDVLNADVWWMCWWRLCLLSVCSVVMTCDVWWLLLTDVDWMNVCDAVWLMWIANEWIGLCVVGCCPGECAVNWMCLVIVVLRPVPVLLWLQMFRVWPGVLDGLCDPVSWSMVPDSWNLNELHDYLNCALVECPGALCNCSMLNVLGCLCENLGWNACVGMWLLLFVTVLGMFALVLCVGCVVWMSEWIVEVNAAVFVALRIVLLCYWLCLVWVWLNLMCESVISAAWLNCLKCVSWMVMNWVWCWFVWCCFVLLDVVCEWSLLLCESR